MSKYTKTVLIEHTESRKHFWEGVWGREEMFLLGFLYILSSYENIHKHHCVLKKERETMQSGARVVLYAESS